MNEAEFEQLKARVTELEAKVSAKERQQIIYPLDPESIKVLNKYFLRIVDQYSYLGGATGKAFTEFIAEQDGIRTVVFPPLVRYTADPGTDVITIVDRQRNDEASPNKVADDDTLVLFTTDTAPGGLAGFGLTTYYVVNAAADGYSCKLSATEGGSAINITNTGTGKQFLLKD